MPKPKRGATKLDGVLAVDKPAGLTSHDVVDRVRRLTGEGRVGHAGTLDPMATGLLLVCVGPACRRSEELMGGDKVYEARIVFGSSTTTDDFEGEVLATATVSECVRSESFARSLLARFVGEQEQLPPQVSAIKKDGVAAYKRVRRGEEVVVEPRHVTVHELELLGIGADVEGVATDGAVWWEVRAVVSKGTYIRSLARDIGEAAGTVAHLGALRRTRIGAIGINEAHTLEELEQATHLGQSDHLEYLEHNNGISVYFR